MRKFVTLGLSFYLFSVLTYFGVISDVLISFFKFIIIKIILIHGNIWLLDC